jgi:hypothetical protein
MRFTLHVVLGGAALLVLVLTVAFGRQSPAPVAAVAQQQEDETPAKKQDRLMPPRDFGIEALRSAMSTPDPRPVTVQTETILPPVVQVQARPTKVASVKRVTDVCQRHGMRKVTIGKRWRCKR